MLVEAAAYSSLLALSSLGLALCIITTRVSNFAHADYMTIGAYAALITSVVVRVHPYAALPVSALLGGLAALASYLLVFEPLRRHGLVTLMIASMALDVIIRALLSILADYLQASLSVYSRGFIFKDITVELAGFKVEGYPLAVMFVTTSALVSLYLLLYHTRVGVKMRAVAESAELAETLGINTKQILALSWFLAGAFAGLAGAMIPYRFVVSPDTGSFILLTLFAAVTLGGLQSLLGSIVGAYVIGFSESALAYLLASMGLSTAYRPLLAFSVIVATLLARPKGLASIWER
ncbi:MAG: branched-chain amino acid ABC transporter permease [Thermofilum sp.]